MDLYLRENSIGKFYLPTDDIVSKVIASGKIFDEHVIKKISLYSGKVALDIGGHVGQMSIHMSKFFDKVYSFEANDEMAYILKENLKINNIKNVEVIEKAVWSQSNIVLPFANSKEIYKSYASCGVIPNNSLEYWMKSIPGSISYKTVNSIAIDDLDIKNISLIKSDIQGADLHGLRGSIRTIKKEQPFIICEYDQFLSKFFNESLQDYKNFIKNIGYKINNQIDYNLFLSPDTTISQLDI